MSDNKFEIVKNALPMQIKVCEQQLPRPAVGYKPEFAVELRMTADRGVGVFTTKFIPAGAQIYDYSMYAFNESELHKLLQSLPTVEQRRWLLEHCWGGPNNKVLMTTSDTIFINHSREPSVLHSPSDSSGNATRDIQPGEELTEDYRLYAEPSYLAELCLEYGIDL